MKTQTCKLARIATVACTSVAPLAVAHAQQAEAVARTMVESAAAADALLALPREGCREGCISTSANFPIVDATESDAQCVTDAANALSVAVSYAAPIAVPVHTDTVATMSTPTAAPFLADAQANELEWGKSRRDAMSLADADIAAPVRPVPLENAARVDDARDLPDVVREDAGEGLQQDAPRDAALPRAAKPALLPNVPLPVHKPPISYAAPVAVPLRAAKADAPVDADSHASGDALSVETALSVPSHTKVLPTVDGFAEWQGWLVTQEDAQAAAAAAHARHVSYAAPVAVPGRSEERTPLLPSGVARKGAKLLAHAQPFMLMHMNSSDAMAADQHALPVRLILPRPGRQPGTRTVFASAIDSQIASGSEALPASTQQAANPPAKLSQATPSEAKPVSYAAPIAVPSRGNASTAASRETQSSAQPQVQPPVHVPTAATVPTSKTDPNWSTPDKVAISDERLDTMRGGFDLSSGLKVSFGVSRMVVVNGNLVTTTSFNIPDIANLSAQQAQQLASVNAGSLIQNGPGNVVQPGAMPALSGAVIQNTLNNQNIQALTTINTTVNSLSMFKNFNVGSTLGGALTNAVRPR
ncbi:hypothetical protein KZJ38_35210 [Paraburkholderia edwinii]|uniref:Uncharacterized protein n=1 Tax=Paraburkholderia edwinii TaxID=2861782 RepID=A0ABX8UXW7_9BURK|nr:hypothetical protein [Paraburkholderia edwinii]QYD72192.1 hypothetical protein KZJ38_35210 [Paraburkholderia edwinii]